jgi:hypothetical protein
MHPIVLLFQCFCEGVIDFVDSDVFFETGNRRIIIYQQVFDAGNFCEIGEMVFRQGHAEARVMRSSAENPGGGVRNRGTL